MSEYNKGILYTALSGLIFGFVPIIFSWSTAYGNNPATALFFHGLVVSPIAFIYARKTHLSLKPEGNETVLLIIAGIFHLFTNLLLDGSYEYIGVGIATAIHFLYPIVVAVILKVYYRDTLTRKQAAALCFAACGIALFSNVSGTANLRGILMAAASSVAYSLYLIVLDRTELRKTNGMKALFWMCLLYMVILGAVSLFRKDVLRFDLPAEAYGLTIMYSLFCGLLGSLLMKAGVSRIGSKLGSILSLLEPVSSLIFGVIFLQEALALPKGIGALFMIAAMGLMLK